MLFSASFCVLRRRPEDFRKNRLRPVCKCDNIFAINTNVFVTRTRGAEALILSVEARDNTGNLSSMVEEAEDMRSIHCMKILARE